MSLSGLSKTVILGSSGFVGRALQRYLTDVGVEVRGYSSRDLDLRERDALSALDGVADPDTTLIFLAALTPDKGVTLETFADNVAMATNVGGFLADHPIRKCVYVSTDAVYGTPTAPVTEDTPTDPANFYSLGKFTSERILQNVAAAGGLPLLILRPVAVYGPGDPHNSYGPNLFSRMAARERVVRIFGEGEERRDHLYVDDLVRTIGELSASDESGVINVATGTSRTFASVVETLRSIAPYEVTVENRPRRMPVTHVEFDVTRLKTALPGLRFTQFEEGLARTLAAAGEEKAG